MTALSSAKAWYKETRRRSVIKPHQIKPWYDTVRMLDNSTIRDYLLLLLFTGMRRIEAMELRWENVDFAEKMLTVPHTKNNEPLDLPLSDYVFRLLQERKKRTGKSPWVFTGDGKTGHLVEPKNSVKKIAEDSGVPFMRLIKRRLAKSLRKSPSLQLTLQIQAMLHVLWLFPEPLELRDTAQREAVFLLYKRFQKMLESYFTAHEYELDKVGDLARVFRVPDTLNHKGEKPVPVTIWEARPDNRVTIEEVKTYLDKHYPKQVKPKKKEHSFPLADADLIREECGWFNYCIEDAETLSEPECYAALSILGRCKDGAALAHEYSKDYPHYSAAETIKKLNQAMLTAKPRTCENIRMECGAEEYCQQCPHFGKISSPIQLGTKRNEASSTKERLLETAKRAKYWHTKNDTAYATITRNGHKEHMVLQSTRFCKRLTFQMREEGGKPPAKQAIDEVPGLLEAQAIFDGLEHEVFLRVAYHDDRLYIDRGTEDWSAIEVRANGWDIIAEPPVRFIRSDSMQPLPETSRKGDIMLLKRYIPCDTPDEFKLIIGFILGVFAPHKPYPLAVLTGLAGCGKTTRARVIVELTDPSSSALIGSPKEDRDIFATASSRWLTTLDNIKQVSDSISNALCCISTGIASSGRLYHTNMGIFETPEFARPMMMTGIELRLRQDLRSRSIFFEFSPLAAKDCKTEREYYECFAQDKPVIFGGILDALSGALCNWKQTEIALQGKEKPRLADHTVWVSAAEKALGWEHGTYCGILLKHQRDGMADSDMNSVFGQAMLGFLSANAHEIGNPSLWQVHELYSDLMVWAEKNLQKDERRFIPRTPATFSKKLRRAVQSLAYYGAEFKFDVTHEGNKRGICITLSDQCLEEAKYRTF